VIDVKLIVVPGMGYPDYRRVVPDATATAGPAVMRVDMDRAEAMEAMTRLMALRDGTRSMCASLVLAGGRVAVTGADAEAGHGEEVLRKADWEWAARRPARARTLSASFNARYLRDLLGGIKAARVSLWLRFIDAGTRMGDPAVLTACGEAEPPRVPVAGVAPGRRLVLMPMRGTDHDDAVVTDLAARMAGAPAGAAGAGILDAAE
jgi:DNA polymerase III sliding clamp (beta) subunit (PCNA family)